MRPYKVCKWRSGAGNYNATAGDCLTLDIKVRPLHIPPHLVPEHQPNIPSCSGQFEGRKTGSPALLLIRHCHLPERLAISELYSPRLVVGGPPVQIKQVSVLVISS